MGYTVKFVEFQKSFENHPTEDEMACFRPL